jgi:hypothetical protein
MSEVDIDANNLEQWLQLPSITEAIKQFSGNRIGYIYKITCLITNKSYVGQTDNTVENRWTEHKTANLILIDTEIHNHGVDNFTCETLMACPIEFLDYFEALMIRLHNTLQPAGYNVHKHDRTTGGNIIGLFYLPDTVSVEVTPIKSNGQNRLVRVLLTLHGDNKRVRLMFGQGKDQTFQNAIDDSLEFIRPFESKGVPINIHPAIRGENDPLANYYLKIREFQTMDIVKVRLAPRKHSHGKVLAVIYIKTTETKGWADEIRVAFGGKNIPIQEAFRTARLFIERLPIKETTQVVITEHTEPTDANH